MFERSSTAGSGLSHFRRELADFWHRLPDKWLLIILLGGWCALFHFFGNSTLGYIKTTSLFGWMDYSYRMHVDDEHGRWVPFVVLALLWWKRNEFLALPTRTWWPALLLLMLALGVHATGYMVQQARLSIVGFYLGVYALVGCVYGPKWLMASFFPFCLFAFCVPVGNLAEPVTFPLRMLATQITTALSHWVLGIQVIQDGTRVFNPNGAYQYEIAAACSGIRSLTVTVGMAMVYAYVWLRTPWRKLVMIVSAVPIAIAANVIRLTTIIIAAEAFGQRAGNYVHESGWLSLLPYVPALLGVLGVGYWLREDRRATPPPATPTLDAVEQKA